VPNGARGEGGATFFIVRRSNSTGVIAELDFKIPLKGLAEGSHVLMGAHESSSMAEDEDLSVKSRRGISCNDGLGLNVRTFTFSICEISGTEKEADLLRNGGGTLSPSTSSTEVSETGLQDNATVGATGLAGTGDNFTGREHGAVALGFGVSEPRLTVLPFGDGACCRIALELKDK